MKQLPQSARFKYFSVLSLLFGLPWKMAPVRKESSVELCARVNAQGNTIAIRMLEYLSTAKSPIHGFQSLSTEFIELCQVLWSIEAGLAEATKTPSGFPIEVSQELDKRVRQVNEEFSVLSQMVNKCMSPPTTRTVCCIALAWNSY